jgi:hypothetical protein
MSVVDLPPEPPPAVDSGSRRASASSRQIDDTDLGRIYLRGALFGLPLAYLVTFLVTLPAGGVTIALVVSIWPAIVAGPWLGATLLMGRRAMQLQAHPRSPEIPTITPAPTTTSSSASADRAA